MPEKEDFTLKKEADQEITQMQSLDTLVDDIHRHIVSNLGNEVYGRNKFHYFNGLAYSLRDRLIRMWLNTQRDYYDSMTKRVYYLSLEFLRAGFS